MAVARRSGVRAARVLIHIGLIASVAASAAISLFAQASANPSTVTTGHAIEVTVSVPASVKVPQDSRQLVATVGMQPAQVTRVRGNAVTVLAPAYVRGSGERDLAIFDRVGNELARATIGYESPEPHKWFAFPLLLLLALPIVMLWVDIEKAYKFAADTRTAIIDHAARNGLTLAEQKLILGDLAKAPPGIPGLARTMIAFMLLDIVAIALFYVLTSGINEVPDIVDKTITVLTTAVTTVIAFYFGARTANVAADAAATQITGSMTHSSAPSAPQPVATPQTIRFFPTTGTVGTDVTLAGRGFGSQPGEVRFGTIKATDVPHWSDGIVRAKVPAGLTAGQKVAIEVIVPGGAHPISSAPGVFTIN
jgi:hypothetical protein